MEKIYSGNGIEIVKRDSKLFLIFDAGEICDRMEEFEISQEEMKLVQKSSMDAYNVILRHKNKMRFGK